MEISKGPLSLLATESLGDRGKLYVLSTYDTSSASTLQTIWLGALLELATAQLARHFELGSSGLCQHRNWHNNMAGA